MTGVSGTSKTEKQYHYYQCVTNRRDKSCGKKSVGKDYIEDLVIHQLREFLTPDNINTIAKEVVDLCERESNNGNAQRLKKLIKIGGQVMTLCDKCLDRLREKLTQRQLAAGEERLKQLREKLAQRVGAEEKPETYDGQIVLITGTEFTATDKLHQTYRYRMIGAEVSHDGWIRLLNLSTNTLTYVEPAWFRNRKIKVLQKEVKSEPGFYDEVGGYHKDGMGTDPDGHFCGECNRMSCKDCAVWRCDHVGEEDK